MNGTLRKLTAWTLSLCMMLSMLPVGAGAVNASELVDMPSEDNWAYPALQAAFEHGILAGNGNKLDPEGTATRAQVATIINRVFGAAEQADVSAFTDMAAGSWYYSEMAKAKQMRTFVGAGSKMLPNDKVTREQMFTVLARAMKLESEDTSALDRFEDGAEVSSWAKGSLAALIEAGYVKGNGGKLYPKADVRRNEVAQVLYNAFQQYVDHEGTYTSLAEGNIVVNTPNVTLKDTKVTGDLILGDGIGDGDFTLDNVTVAGRVVVRGGGENSIKITNGSNVGNIIISKTSSGGVRVFASGGARVDIVQVSDGEDAVKLEGAFREVQVATETQLVLADANVSQLTIAAANADVSIDSGTVAAVSIAETAAAATISTSEKSSVGKLSVASDAKLEIAGAVSEIAVNTTNAEASAPTLALADSAKVNTLSVSKGADVTVQTDKAGTIGTIKAEDTKSVTVVSSSDSVKSQLETKTEAGSGTSAGGGGGAGGSSSGGDSPSPSTPSGTVTTEAGFYSALENSSISRITIAGNISITDYCELTKPVTINSGVTVTVENWVDIESTLTNNGTLTLKSYRSTITDGGRIVNNSRILGWQDNDSSLIVYGVLENKGTIYGSALSLYAYKNSTISGYTGKIYTVFDPDVYTAAGGFVSGDTTETITVSEGATLQPVYDAPASPGDLVAYAYGTQGLDNALKSDTQYRYLELKKDGEAAADTGNNAVSVSGTVQKSTNLSVEKDVKLSLVSEADLTVTRVSLEGTLEIPNGARLRADDINVSGGVIRNSGNLAVRRVYLSEGAKAYGMDGISVRFAPVEDFFYANGEIEHGKDYVIEGQYVGEELSSVRVG